MAFFLNRLMNRPTVAVVRLEGVIAASGSLGGGTINDQAVAPLLERAFASKPAAVALAINSPGGSPVQSALVAGRIRRLADEKGIPVIAFCEDVAASGGYWLAVAADEVFADANSIVGSIGVISAGFGFHEFIGRHGIERRVHTAGANKGLLDPFQPEKESDVARLKTIQKEMHDSFIAHVRSRRGARLKDDGSGLFDGDFWRGEVAVGLGLIDGLGQLVPVMKDRFGDKTRFSVQKPRRGLARRLGLPGAGQAATEVLGAAEARTIWARYGL